MKAKVLETSEDVEVTDYGPNFHPRYWTKAQGYDADELHFIEDRDVWSEHPDHPRSDWQHEVASGDTNRGYWDYVQAKIEEGE